MQYRIDFQYKPRDSERPQDDGAVVDLRTDEKGFALIPVVGDFIDIDNSKEHGGASFKGRVATRLFSYVNSEWCVVNIVVEEWNDNWGSLIKM